MPRLRLPRSRPRPRETSPLLLLGAGAVLGLALGTLMGDRLIGALRAGRRRADLDPWAHAAHGAFDGDEEADSDADGDADAPAPGEPAVPSIERRVLEAFRNDPVLAERAIDIGEEGPGRIVLTGWVRAEREIDHARTIAGGVPGVARVEADLAVRPPRRPWTVRGAAPDATRRGA